MEFPLWMETRKMQQPTRFLDAESVTELGVIDIPDEVTLMEYGTNQEPTAWHTFSPDRADALADEIRAAAARARR